MAAGGRRFLHSYRARRVARYECPRGRAAARAGGRTQTRWVVRTGRRPAAGTEGRTAVPRYRNRPPGGVRICRTVGAVTLVPIDRAALTSRCCGARCSELSGTTVTAAATSATQTPVCRLSETSSAASYSPATWTRRFPTRSGSSTKTAGASEAASNSNSNSSRGHARTDVRTAARTTATSDNKPRAGRGPRVAGSRRRRPGQRGAVALGQRRPGALLQAATASSITPTQTGVRARRRRGGIVGDD